MSNPEPGFVQVKIYDREYSFRTTGDPERLLQLCIDLDKRMREVAESTGAVDTLKVAILVALGLSDDLEHAQEELKKIDEALSRRSLECVSMLDRFLA
ncbi:MAG TPA: cell division protein ZapA [Acidobacteriota bacterium]|nr:cell division protein ZapA [Acidobacteriota bacterium]